MEWIKINNWYLYKKASIINKFKLGKISKVIKIYDVKNFKKWIQNNKKQILFINEQEAFIRTKDKEDKQEIEKDFHKE